MADATTCIRNHWPPFGAAMPRALRSVAMALLDVRAQRLSPRGRLRPIDFGLLWIAELDATGFGGGQRMACALGDQCRSCSAAAASTVLLTTEKIRALVDNIRGKKDRDIEGEVVKKDDDDG